MLFFELYSLWSLKIFTHIWCLAIFFIFLKAYVFLANILVLSENISTCFCILIHIFKICYWKFWVRDWRNGSLAKCLLHMLGDLSLDPQHQDKKYHSKKLMPVYFYSLHAHTPIYTYPRIHMLPYIIQKERETDRQGKTETVRHRETEREEYVM